MPVLVPVPVPVLEIKNLQKTYRNDLQALKGIDLTVQSGDFYALLGKNGAGKSTTIGIITSLIKKTAGMVLINGFNLEKNPIEAKMHVGVVPQEFNFNAFEKVKDILINQALYYGIPLHQAKKRADVLLAQMNLLDKKEVSARQLSGGMKRRMMIARALMHEPKILILDEPTAGVDIEIRQAMWKFLKKINLEGVTIILTTHYLEEAENLCNKIAIIDQGKILIDTEMALILRELEFETVILEIENIKTGDRQILEKEIRKEQPLQVFIDELKDQGFVIYRVRNKSNRLEQLFMHLTEKNSGEKS